MIDSLRAFAVTIQFHVTQLKKITTFSWRDIYSELILMDNTTLLNAERKENRSNRHVVCQG